MSTEGDRDKETAISIATSCNGYTLKLVEGSHTAYQQASFCVCLLIIRTRYTYIIVHILVNPELLGTEARSLSAEKDCC